MARKMRGCLGELRIGFPQELALRHKPVLDVEGVRRIVGNVVVDPFDLIQDCCSNAKRNRRHARKNARPVLQRRYGISNSKRQAKSRGQQHRCEKVQPQYLQESLCRSAGRERLNQDQRCRHI